MNIQNWDEWMKKNHIKLYGTPKPEKENVKEDKNHAERGENG